MFACDKTMLVGSDSIVRGDILVALDLALVIVATYLYKVIRRVRRIAGHHNALVEVPERRVGVVWNAERRRCEERNLQTVVRGCAHRLPWPGQSPPACASAGSSALGCVDLPCAGRRCPRASSTGEGHR